MSIVESFKDLVKLIQQSDNLDLHRKVNAIQTEVMQLAEKLRQKEERVKQLEEAMELRGKLIPKDSAYWLTDGHDNVTDGPFCIRCFEVDKAVRRLVASERETQVKCPTCNSECSSKSAYYCLRPDVVEAIKKVEESSRDEVKPRLLTDCF